MKNGVRSVGWVGYTMKGHAARHGFAVPRRDAPGLCRNRSPQETEGAGNAGCPMHPQPVCIGSKHTVVTTGSPVSAGIPCTMVLRLTPRSPRRRIRLVTVAGPGRPRKTSADLTPATGTRTTRLHRPQQHRSSARRRSLTGQSPPCHHVSRTTLPRPPHPAPNLFLQSGLI